MDASQSELGSAFLADAREELQACRRKIKHCVEQLDEVQLWARAGEGLNTISNLMLHLTGNLRQRIGSLVGGKPDTRDRPREFAARGGVSKSELIARFDSAVDEADAVLAALPTGRLMEKCRFAMLQGTVERTLEGLILSTLVHLGGHMQEIVTLTRQQLGEAYRFQVAEAATK